MSTQYRVVWKRKDGHRKVKLCSMATTAERRMALLTSDAPWEAFGQDPDATFCCDGAYCHCGGATIRKHHEDLRAELPPIEYARIERREVGEWEESQ